MTQHGTYSFVTLDEQTKQQIIKYLLLCNIPNPVPIEELHCTLLNTTDIINDYLPIYTYNHPLIGTVNGLQIWKTQLDKNCLVLVFDCPDLHDRYNLLVKEHSINTVYSKYILSILVI